MCMHVFFLSSFFCVLPDEVACGLLMLQTQLAMYLDTSESNQLRQDTRVDYSVALNAADDSPVQDFVFNLGLYNESTPAAGGGQRRFIASGSNNALRPGTCSSTPARSPIAITQSGWYIFQHLFYPQNSTLFANLTIYAGTDCSGAQVGRWTHGPAGFSPPPGPAPRDTWVCEVWRDRGG